MKIYKKKKLLKIQMDGIKGGKQRNHRPYSMKKTQNITHTVSQR